MLTKEGGFPQQDRVPVDVDGGVRRKQFFLSGVNQSARLLAEQPSGGACLLKWLTLIIPEIRGLES